MQTEKTEAKSRLVLQGALHLWVLWCFAVAQPLFSLLSQRENLAFFTAHQAKPLDYSLFALMLAFVMPAVLLLLLGLVHRLSSRMAEALRKGLCFILVMLIALPVLNAFNAWGDGIVILLAFLAAGWLWFLYSRYQGVRFYLTILTPVILAFPLVFLLFSPIRKQAFPKPIRSTASPVIHSQTPVVLIVLDELPTSSLLDAQGHIDPVRYPNFSALARQATWYPYATTVADRTAFAVPIIFSSLLPNKFRAGVFRDYPNNLFTFLGGSYQLHVEETLTRMCPEHLCPNPESKPWLQRQAVLLTDAGLVYLHMILPQGRTTGLPAINQDWANFGNAKEATDTRIKAFERMNASISLDNPLQSLYAIHVELPHGPWRYLPSGKTYDDANGSSLGIPMVRRSKKPDQTHESIHWYNDWMALQAYQQHLLQLGYTDRLLGQTLEALEKNKLFDPALIIVVADHGVHFGLKGETRAIDPENYADILRVPLVVKYPYQKSAQVSNLPAETIDILPTIADVLGAAIPWHVDGKSLLSTNFPKRPVRVVYDRLRKQTSYADQEIRSNTETLARKLRVFGSGEAGLYRLGDYPKLFSTKPDSHPVSKTNRWQARYHNAQTLEHVNPADRDFIPARLFVSLKPTDKPDKLPGKLAVALAVNQRIVALSQAYPDTSGQEYHASFLFPVEALQDGKNNAELFMISQNSSGQVELERPLNNLSRP